jgi:sulfate permease, SulP family
LAVTAASIVAAMPAGAAPEATFMTVVATGALTTLATAALFITVGSFKWARLIRYLPYPVVGGFLAGTGWLLFMGGMGVMAGMPPGWSYGDLFGADVWLRWVPGFGFGLALVAITGRFKHYLVWPGLLLGAVMLFFVVMSLSGASLEEWRARGLLLGPFPETSLLTPIDYAQLTLVHWPLLLAHAASAATVILVSLMALLLNATGLELVTGRKVDLNRELRVTGLGNLLAGAAGGMVGYQVLSFTMLNHKVGTGSRLATLIAVTVVVMALLFGARMLSFIPTMIIGGLLVFLGLSLLSEWVYGAYFKLPWLEYVIILLILVVIATVGFLQGVGVGIVAAVILFVVNYSRAEAIKHALSGRAYRSRVSRGKRERQYLQEQGDKLFILQLQGYLFFGTANSLLERIEARLGESPPVQYVLLDFRQVSGLDATALLSFAKMMQLAKQRGFTLVMTELKAVAWQLEQNGIKPAPRENLRVFATLDEGLEWCEAQLLAASEHAHKPQPTFEERLEAFMGFEASRLLDYFERLEVAPGHYLMKQGDAPDVLYFVASGQVTARLEREGQAPVRLETMRGGSIVGELGFYTGGVRTASVVADEASAIYRLTDEALTRMTRHDPELAASFHKLVVRLLADRVAHLMRVVEALQR